MLADLYWGVRKEFCYACSIPAFASISSDRVSGDCDDDTVCVDLRGCAPGVITGAIRSLRTIPAARLGPGCNHLDRGALLSATQPLGRATPRPPQSRGTGEDAPDPSSPIATRRACHVAAGERARNSTVPAGPRARRPDTCAVRRTHGRPPRRPLTCLSTLTSRRRRRRPAVSSAAMRQ